MHLANNTKLRLLKNDSTDGEDYTDISDNEAVRVEAIEHEMLLSGGVSAFVSPPDSTQGAQVNSATTEAENTSEEAIPILPAVNTSTPPDNT